MTFHVLGGAMEHDYDLDSHHPEQLPFHPLDPSDLDWDPIPRYLFRVFSAKSSGWNSSKWMRSEAALYANVDDIFSRNDASNIAVAINEHLRWQFSMPIPERSLISWTASFAFALQLAVHKRCRERLGLYEVYLCVLDTSMFPAETFIRDLTLMEAFQSKVPQSRTIWFNGYRTSWRRRGLEDLYELRKSSHDFAEYLAQGQLRIEGRSTVISCDKIINQHLRALTPHFNDCLRGRFNGLANEVNSFRDTLENGTRRPITTYEYASAATIAKELPPRWRVMMIASLLALGSRPRGDPGPIPLDFTAMSYRDRYESLDKHYPLALFDRMPEVVQFRRLMGTMFQIYEDYVGGLSDDELLYRGLRMPQITSFTVQFV